MAQMGWQIGNLSENGGCSCGRYAGITSYRPQMNRRCSAGNRIGAIRLLNFTLTVDSAPLNPKSAPNGQVGPEFGPQILRSVLTNFRPGPRPGLLTFV